MSQAKYAILHNAKELFCGKLLRVTDAGLATIATISALDLLLVGDGPCDHVVERPISQADFFDDRADMLAAAKNIYQMNC